MVGKEMQGKWQKVNGKWQRVNLQHPALLLPFDFRF
jgi:hypothetical protein